ncbi:MAG: tRNA (adenosine(37)-N6)-threonylcarbamoyltransferase complex dimerization subunit type 1 TsaB [Clostridia bacterium]|nr:tRNA (adenosine(37)-N6)-threonylcarbamoyltransferase complex dimerization subunit type 1 TsaB [Clostridia bacterium]
MSMNILCLNTAFSEAQISLKFLHKEYFKRVDSNSKHSENLLVNIEKIFEKVIKTEKLNKTSHDILKQLDVLSVVIGPGSFTGLRISIATAKAMLITNPNLKIIAINSLELMASEYAKSSKIKTFVSPLIDALSSLYFTASYDKNLKCIISPKMIDKAELKDLKNIISLDNELSDNLVQLTPQNLLELTEKKIKDKEFIKENELVPLYLRPSQAEAELKCKKK